MAENNLLSLEVDVEAGVLLIPAEFDREILVNHLVHQHLAVRLRMGKVAAVLLDVGVQHLSCILFLAEIDEKANQVLGDTHLVGAALQFRKMRILNRHVDVLLLHDFIHDTYPFRRN